MKKILFPTDFSKASLNAFAYALRFASKINAEIITLHIYGLPPATTMEDYDFLLQTYIVTELSEFENYKSEVPKFKRIAQKLNLEHVAMSHVLQQGNTVAEILSVAKQENPDYIFMGTKGASGLKEVFLGTVAEKIINQSKVPVFAIPGDAKFKGMNKILFLTEIDKFELDAFEMVKSLASLFDAKVEVLEVKAAREDDDERNVKKWNAYFSNSPVHFNMIHSNATEDIITDYITTHHIDVTAMVVHHKKLWQRLFFYSLSRNMAYHTTTPLLSIPVK